MSYFIGHCSASVDIIINNAQKQQRTERRRGDSRARARTRPRIYFDTNPSDRAHYVVATPPSEPKRRISDARRPSNRSTGWTTADGTGWNAPLPRSTTRSNSPSVYTEATVPPAPGAIECKVCGQSVCVWSQLVDHRLHDGTRLVPAARRRARCV